MSDTTNRNTKSPIDGAPGCALTIDWDRYGRLLEASDLSEDDKRAFIRTVWNIMVAFVDLGYRLSPVEQTCGQVELTSVLTAAADQAVLECEEMDRTKIFEKAAAPVAEKDVA